MGEKKVTGRKRHLLVDSDGRLLKVFVSAADWSDSEGGAYLLDTVLPALPRLSLVWADSAYQSCADWLHWKFDRRITLDLVASPSPHSFVVAPRRWVVERSFAWLSFWRRLTKEFEVLPASSQTFIYFVASMHLLRRLSS